MAAGDQRCWLEVWAEAKNGDLHCSSHPTTGSTCRWHSILTQTHRILVSQFKNRLSGTILPFSAVSGLHIRSLFQPLLPSAFSLSLPSSRPRRSVAEYLPVRERRIPLFGPCRMAASKFEPVPAQLALAGGHPAASPARSVPKEPQLPLLLPLRNTARDGWKKSG